MVSRIMNQFKSKSSDYMEGSVMAPSDGFPTPQENQPRYLKRERKSKHNSLNERNLAHANMAAQAITTILDNIQPAFIALRKITEEAKWKEIHQLKR